jgi:hypothetical protein
MKKVTRLSSTREIVRLVIRRANPFEIFRAARVRTLAFSFCRARPSSLMSRLMTAQRAGLDGYQT